MSNKKPTPFKQKLIMQSIQNKAYKYRIYPTRDQKTLLNQTFGCARFVWNKMVENFEKGGEEIHLPTLKEEFPFLKDVSAAALAQKRRDFFETKKQFFSKGRKIKIGKPNFKKKGKRDSYRLEIPTRFNLDYETKKIRLEKIGWISIRIHRDIPSDSKLRNITVSKTPTNQYYVSILTEETVYHKPKTGKSIGLDMGIKAFITTSEGDILGALQPFRENQAKLKKAQQHLSRKKGWDKKTKTKPSKRYLTQKMKVAKIHEKIASQRKHFHHVLSHKIISEYDLICVETLNVKGMVKNKRLSKSISDAGWSEFIRQLEYKAKWYGKELVKVDRFFPSTKLCSKCQTQNDSLSLSDRSWTCKACNATHDRDKNAATNILVEGLNRRSASITDVEKMEVFLSVRNKKHSLVKRLG